MKRLAISVSFFAVVAALTLPGLQEVLASATDPGVCGEMTPAKILADPALAHEYAQALRAGDEADLRRLDALVARLRAVHGCEGEEAADDGAKAGALPPGHPPVGGPRGGGSPAPATPLLDQTPPAVTI